VGEIAFLLGVDDEVVELELVRLGLGDHQRLPPVRPFVALAGDGPELGAVVVSR
jgi:hypothetical protein